MANRRYGFSVPMVTYEGGGGELEGETPKRGAPELAAMAAGADVLRGGAPFGRTGYTGVEGGGGVLKGVSS